MFDLLLSLPDIYLFIQNHLVAYWLVAETSKYTELELNGAHDTVEVSTEICEMNLKTVKLYNS